MLRPLAAALALSLAASPLLAWTHRDGARIEPRGAGGFEVLARPGLSASEAWCAAGDYAGQALNLGPQARIWRASPAPRRVGQGIAFTLSPEGSAGKTGLFLFGPDDGSISVAFARQLCWGQHERG